MVQKSKYGDYVGIEDRLDVWAQRLARDKTLPWIGLGIIADLTAAAMKLRGEPEDEFANFQKPAEPGRTWSEWEDEFANFQKPANQEYDL